MLEKEVHGFAVRCDISGNRSIGFKLVVSTSHREQSIAAQEWKVPSDPTFESREDADRHAKYIIRGIESVDPSGKPKFSVT